MRTTQDNSISDGRLTANRPDPDEIEDDDILEDEELGEDDEMDDDDLDLDEDTDGSPPR